MPKIKSKSGKVKSPRMSKKNVVVVESPTKARTIGKILGSQYVVVSSMGHLIDLPQKELGVDIENNFEPTYTVLKGRKKLLTDLKKEAKDKKTVYIATDPDREGEAIGWQIKERVFKGKKVMRVVFHEITTSAVKQAFDHPREFDAHMIEAQVGRRVLDRIVGYFLSPLLWKKIARGLSAGRVQSVALRLIVDRERQILKFTPQEYWEIEAELEKLTGEPVNRLAGSFAAKLDKINDKKAEIKNKEEADRIVAELKLKQFIVTDIKEKSQKRNPSAPFITSTLQQEAFNKLHYNATKTMIVAQQLYEGIEIGQDGPVGLITYMRTDSPHVAPEAINEVRGHIAVRYGKQYVPDIPNVYKVKRHAQQAHEAIRPTMIGRPAESLQEYLSPDQYKLYELIYNRFLASQMASALYRVTSVAITADTYQFSASSSRLEFDGFSAVYNIKDEDEEDKDKKTIPPLAVQEGLQLVQLNPSQHFTKPPPRYSDSSLVKALEEEGIGRPSTYAPIIQTLLLRNYIRRIKGYFSPTELGEKVCDMLVEYFARIMDIKFTAQMEEELDAIEEGKAKRIEVLKDFFDPFKQSIDYAQEHIKKEIITTSDVCEKCGKPMVIKWGRKGKFLSCSDFPQCTFSKSITSGVKCPAPDCGGELIERRSIRGFFYGCSKYPKCTFTSRTLPEQNPPEAAAGQGPA